MRGSFNITLIKAHLSKAWELSHLDCMGLSKLAKCLGSETEAKAWLDTVVTAYTSHTRKVIRRTCISYCIVVSIFICSFYM